MSDFEQYSNQLQLYLKKIVLSFYMKLCFNIYKCAKSTAEICNPRSLTGTGLFDVDGTECCWSYLGDSVL